LVGCVTVTHVIVVDAVSVVIDVVVSVTVFMDAVVVTVVVTVVDLWLPLLPGSQPGNSAKTQNVQR